MVEGTPKYKEIAQQVMRPDIYEEAMRELGLPVSAPQETPEQLFDGVTFDVKHAEEYALSFAVKNPKG
jgi:nitrate/nitrite transport system substrate-binding protein